MALSTAFRCAIVKRASVTYFPHVFNKSVVASMKVIVSLLLLVSLCACETLSHTEKICIAERFALEELVKPEPKISLLSMPVSQRTSSVRCDALDIRLNLVQVIPHYHLYAFSYDCAGKPIATLDVWLIDRQDRATWDIRAREYRHLPKGIVVPGYDQGIAPRC